MTGRPESSALVDALLLGERIAPAAFRGVPAAGAPGLYGWWADAGARDVIGEVLGSELPALVYVGQAGATKWPSGTPSTATLRSRVGGQHIRGNARSSTFRKTLTSVLLEPLALRLERPDTLNRSTNLVLSAWIAQHLRVSIAPFPDRDRLGPVEAQVVVHLDPPLNLDHVASNDTRRRLRELRRVVALGGSGR